MPVTQGVFGAPVWMPDKPNVLGSFAALRSMAREDEKLQLEKDKATSLDSYRQSLTAVKDRSAAAAELAAVVKLAGDHPDEATEFLNGNERLLSAYGIKPGQIQFEGGAKNRTVVTNKETGDIFVVDRTNRDPQKAIMKVGNMGGTTLTRQQILGRALQGLPENELVDVAKSAGGGKGGKRTPNDIKGELYDLYLAKGLKGLSPRQKILFDDFMGTDPDFTAAIKSIDTSLDEKDQDLTPEQRTSRAASLAQQAKAARRAQMLAAEDDAAADDEEDGADSFDSFAEKYGLTGDDEE